MTEEKECGYKVGNVYFHKLKGFEQLWNSTDVATKDMIVNEVGALVKKLHLHGVSKCEEPVGEPPCKHSDWVDLYGDCHDYYGRLCTDCNEWIK